MASVPVRTSARAARRLAITRQHLAGRRPTRVTPERLVETIRELPYVQWDPVSVVAPAHILSLWARLGSFRLSDLDRLLWKDRRLLQHWIPFAAIVGAEDYPLYAAFMRQYPESLSSSWGSQRTRARTFLTRHADLRRRALADLKSGPRLLNQFRDHGRTKRPGDDWQPSSALSEMLWHLLMSGEVMVVGHEGAQNLWGLSEAFLPRWVDRKELSLQDAERAAAERALMGLGVGTAREIHTYFVRGCYQDIDATLDDLVAKSRIVPVAVDGLPGKERRFVHRDCVDLLARLEDGPFVPRVAVLPPFDNMVYSQRRGRRLFGFDYVREQFLPKEKRRYGMWVLPIVRGDQFVGRVDASLDKKEHCLRILAAFAEKGRSTDRSLAIEIREELEGLAAFLGADSVAFSSKVPAGWSSALR